MDAATFEASPIEDNPIVCPACRQTHRWSKKDALLERDDNQQGAR